MAALQAALLPQLAALPCPRVEVPSEVPSESAALQATAAEAMKTAQALMRLRLPILQGLPQRWGATRSIKSQGSALILRLLRLQGLQHYASFQEAAETATTTAAVGEGDLCRVTRPCMSNALRAAT